MIYFGTEQAARHLECSTQNVCRMCGLGKFPNAYRDGYRWQIPLDDIVAYRERHPEKFATCPHCGILTGGVVCDDCRRERAGGGYRWYEAPELTSTWREGRVRL